MDLANKLNEERLMECIRYLIYFSPFNPYQMEMFPNEVRTRKIRISYGLI
jgi:hypothetical protein